MSHFLVMVIGNDAENQLAKYNETEGRNLAHLSAIGSIILA